MYSLLFYHTKMDLGSRQRRPPRIIVPFWRGRDKDGGRFLQPRPCAEDINVDEVTISLLVKGLTTEEGK